MRKISLDNFQSHESTALQLHSGLNVILGSSDSGKSSIARAIRWAVENRPTGENFRSNWGGGTKVKIEFEDCVVERVRDKAVNEYRVKSEGVEQVYKAFAQSVPEEVTEKVMLHPYSLQFQHDPPFLLTITPGERAKLLNEVVGSGLFEIDATMSAANYTVRGLTTQLQTHEDQIEELQEELKTYRYLEGLQKILATCKTHDTACSKLQRSVFEIELRLSRLEELKDKRAQLLKVSRLDKQAKRCNELNDKCNELKDEIWTLNSLVQKIEQIQISKEQLNGKVQHLSAKYEKIKPNICPLCKQKWNR